MNIIDSLLRGLLVILCSFFGLFIFLRLSYGSLSTHAASKGRSFSTTSIEFVQLSASWLLEPPVNVNSPRTTSSF
jgi:hypothetical protein